MRHVIRVVSRIDHGRAHNARVAIDIQASTTVIDIGYRRSQIDVPVLGSGVGVEGVHAVVRGSNVNDVVRAAADADATHNERLRVYLIIYGQPELQAEGVHVHIRLGQDSFA